MNDTHTTFRIAEDVDVLSLAHPVPGAGFLPIRSYLIRGREPVLIDTGAVAAARGFLAALESLVDPADLSWIVVSHPDADHVGALPALLEKAPRAKIVLNWVSTGKLSATLEPPLARIRWVNAGESFAAGDRVLHFLRPPMFDCPSTVAVFDSKSRALFSSDASGPSSPRRPTPSPSRRAPTRRSKGCPSSPARTRPGSPTSAPTGTRRR